ncbi:MAG: hypothetical protein M1830_007369 [Pleopsidium flavum]|nr:MAG: hypothetical protein M1830_007369 [Pleopsidium flavum]
MEDPQLRSGYDRCGRGYHDVAADAGFQPSNGYHFRPSGPYARRYPDDNPRVLDRFEEYKGKPEWSALVELRTICIPTIIVPIKQGANKLHGMTFQVDELGSIPATIFPTIDTCDFSGDHACNFVLGLEMRDTVIQTLKSPNKKPRIAGPRTTCEPAVTDTKTSVQEECQTWRLGCLILMQDQVTSHTRLMKLRPYLSKTSSTPVRTSNRTVGSGCGQEIIIGDMILTSPYLFIGDVRAFAKILL